MSSPNETQAKVPDSERGDVTLPFIEAGRDTTQDSSSILQYRGPVQLPAPFGRYELQKLVATGGMGSVFLAHDKELDRSVALKIPLFSERDGVDVLERFKREARSAATIHHANVCPLYDIGEFNGVPFLTMAFIEGTPLAQFVAEHPLTHRQIASLIRKLALALQEAHNCGVIHRDLKPGNIMMDKRAEPLIMDFGLARRTQKKEIRLTQEGTMLGTPVYMPPEQVTGKVDAMGAACDIYSLGVILYELLAGRVPFQGRSSELLAQILLDEPTPPSAYATDLDPQLEAICLKAMAKQPSARFASMTDFALELQDYIKAGLVTPIAPPNDNPMWGTSVYSPALLTPVEESNNASDAKGIHRGVIPVPIDTEVDEPSSKLNVFSPQLMWLWIGFITMLFLVLLLVLTR
jgi:serine/threonine protein kinase